MLALDFTQAVTPCRHPSPPSRVDPSRKVGLTTAAKPLDPASIGSLVFYPAISTTLFMNERLRKRPVLLLGLGTMHRDFLVTRSWLWTIFLTLTSMLQGIWPARENPTERDGRPLPSSQPHVQYFRAIIYVQQSTGRVRLLGHQARCHALDGLADVIADQRCI